MRKYAIPLTILLGVFLIIFVPVIINESYKFNNPLYITVWDGSDILSFYGALLSTCGTLILGCIAWKQNERLLMIEERGLLSEHSGIVMITELKIKGVHTIACDLSDLHVEQVIHTEDSIGKGHLEYRSVSIECKLEPMIHSQHSTYVRIESLTLFGGSEIDKLQPLLPGEKYDDQYSSIAISKGFDRLGFTVIMSKEEYDLFIRTVDDINSIISIDIDVVLLTDKYVATELKCRSSLFCSNCDEKEGIYNHFKAREEHAPMCFWNGVSLKQHGEIRIKTVKK